MVNSLIALLLGIVVGGAGLLGIHELSPSAPTPAPVIYITQPVDPDTMNVDTPAPPRISLGATNANSIETTVALFETTLANSITSSALTMTLTSATTKDGTTLASSTYAFIIDEGTASQEFVRADCTGTSCTNMERGISVLTGTTSVTALMKAHRRGASVKITTGPSLIELTNLINGRQSIRSPLLFDQIAKYTSAPTFTLQSNQLISAKYAEDYANTVIAGGAPTSTNTLGGKVLLATQLQMASSTDLGITAPLVIQAKYSTSSPGTAGIWNVITNNAGKIAQTFLDFTQAWSFQATTSIAASNASTTALVLNGIPYQLPASRAASSTVLTENGWGHLAWQTPDWRILVSTTTTTSQATTTVTGIPPAQDLRIVLSSASTSGSQNTLVMQFNGDTGASSYCFNAQEDFNTLFNGCGVSAIQLSIGSAVPVTWSGTIDVQNTAGRTKTIQSRISIARGGTGSDNYQSFGAWSNQSAQISSISFGSATNIPAGTRITVYGSNF